MTQELAEKLVAWYEESIAMIKEKELENVVGILRKRRIGCGVCLCAFANFDIYLKEDSWVKSQAKQRGYWGKQPMHAKTKEEVIQCLQLRVDVLKTFDGE